MHQIYFIKNGGTMFFMLHFFYLYLGDLSISIHISHSLGYLHGVSLFECNLIHLTSLHLIGS